MHKVGDPIDGYCQKCKRNVYMNVAATDGREIFATVCRTCQAKQDYHPEVSAEVLQEQAMRKLMRTAARKRKMPMGRSPDVVSRGRRGEGRAAYDASVLDRAIAERQSRLAVGDGDRPAGRRLVDLHPRDMISFGRDSAPREGAAPVAERGDRDDGLAVVTEELGHGEATPRAEAAPVVVSEGPAQRLSDALRHRPSLADGPVPAGRRRSGAGALQMPMSVPKPKEEVLPPPAQDSDITSRWRQLTAKLGPRDGKVYASDKSYGVGDVLLHKRHGMGIVEEIVHETAMMVLFRDARQVIEMARVEAR